VHNGEPTENNFEAIVLLYMERVWGGGGARGNLGEGGETVSQGGGRVGNRERLRGDLKSLIEKKEKGTEKNTLDEAIQFIVRGISGKRKERWLKKKTPL